MSIETIESQLERVQTRIAQIESGAKEYGIGNRRVVNHELAVLYEREAELKAALAEASGSNYSFAQIGRL